MWKHGYTTGVKETMGRHWAEEEPVHKGIYSSTMARVHSILGFLAPIASLQVIWLTVFGGVGEVEDQSRGHRVRG